MYTIVVIPQIINHDKVVTLIYGVVAQRFIPAAPDANEEWGLII
jgi:hypothetical protein